VNIVEIKTLISNLEHATRFWKTLIRYAQSSENKIQIILLKSVEIVTVMVKNNNVVLHPAQTVAS
jgi:hypothetical protein